MKLCQQGITSRSTHTRLYYDLNFDSHLASQNARQPSHPSKAIKHTQTVQEVQSYYDLGRKRTKFMQNGLKRKMRRPETENVKLFAFLLVWCVSTSPSYLTRTKAFTPPARARNQQHQWESSPTALQQHGFRYLSAGDPNTKYENGGTGRGEYPSVDTASKYGISKYHCTEERNSVGHHPTSRSQHRRAQAVNPQQLFSSTDPHDLKGRAELQATRAILLRRHNSLEQSQYELRKSQISQEKAQMDLKEANVQLRLSKSTISSLSDKVVALQQELLDLRQGQRNISGSTTPPPAQGTDDNETPKHDQREDTALDDTLLLVQRMDREQEQYWKGVVEELRHELKEMQAKLDHQNVLLEQHNRKLMPVEEQQRLRFEPASSTCVLTSSSQTNGMQLDEPPGGWKLESSCDWHESTPTEEYDIVADYTQRWSADSDSSP